MEDRITGADRIEAADQKLLEIMQEGRFSVSMGVERGNPDSREISFQFPRNMLQEKGMYGEPVTYVLHHRMGAMGIETNARGGQFNTPPESNMAGITVSFDDAREPGEIEAAILGQYGHQDLGDLAQTVREHMDRDFQDDLASQQNDLDFRYERRFPALDR